jgi:hypothetical protein
MNASQPENHPTPGQPPEEQVFTHALNSIDLFEEVVGDTTVRPLRPSIRRQIRLRQEPPVQAPLPEDTDS